LGNIAMFFTSHDRLRMFTSTKDARELPWLGAPHTVAIDEIAWVALRRRLPFLSTIHHYPRQ
jgi:hypothetical protein